MLGELREPRHGNHAVVPECSESGDVRVRRREVKTNEDARSTFARRPPARQKLSQSLDSESGKRQQGTCTVQSLDVVRMIAGAAL